MTTGDPLQALRDIHMPLAPSIWPPAPGWWFLAFLILVGLVLSGILAIRQWHRTQPYRHALKTLRLLSVEEDEMFFLTQVSILLKRFCLAYFPRHEVAGLQGQAWLVFLDEVGKTQAFSAGLGRLLSEAPYQVQVSFDKKALSQLIRCWMKQALRGRKRYV